MTGVPAVMIKNAAIAGGDRTARSPERERR